MSEVRCAKCGSRFEQTPSQGICPKCSAVMPGVSVDEVITALTGEDELKSAMRSDLRVAAVVIGSVAVIAGLIWLLDPEPPPSARQLVVYGPQGTGLAGYHAQLTAHAG